MQRCLLCLNKMRKIAMQHKRSCNESARITAVSTFLGLKNELISPSKAMDKHCRAAIVCMMGMRKFGRCAMMAPVGKDAMLMIARLMWNDCVDGAWVVQNEQTQSKKARK